MRWSIVFIALSGTAAAAQPPVDLTGKTVRLQSTTRGSMIGTVETHRTDSIVVRHRGGSAVAFSLRSLSRLDSLVPGGDHADKGALIGGAFGLLVAAAYTSGLCGGDTVCDGSENAFAFVAIVLPAFALGALIGTGFKRDQWSPIATNPRVEARRPMASGIEVGVVAPARGGLGVGIRLSW